MVTEGWELLIRHSTNEIKGASRYYFHLEINDTTATYRERAASLSISLTGLVQWFERWRLMYSWQTKTTSVLWRRRQPSYGWWDDGSINFKEQHGSWLVDPTNYVDAIGIGFFGGFEDGAKGWNSIGPLPYGFADNGRYTDFSIAVCEDFADRHVQPYTTVLGDIRRGGILTSSGEIVPAFDWKVKPFITTAIRRRRRL